MSTAKHPIGGSVKVGHWALGIGHWALVINSSPPASPAPLLLPHPPRKEKISKFNL